MVKKGEPRSGKELAPRRYRHIEQDSAEQEQARWFGYGPGGYYPNGFAGNRNGCVQIDLVGLEPSLLTDPRSLRTRR